MCIYSNCCCLGITRAKLPLSKAFQVGDLYLHQNATMIILSISRELGFNKYNIMDVDSGMTNVAHKHELKK